MSSIWRNVCKIAFNISLVAAIGTLILITSKAPSAEDAIIVFLLGCIIILIVFSTYGAALEFFDNVAKIKQKVCKSSAVLSPKIKAPDYYYECECGCNIEEGASYCPRCGKKQELSK